MQVIKRCWNWLLTSLKHIGKTWVFFMMFLCRCIFSILILLSLKSITLAAKLNYERQEFKIKTSMVSFMYCRHIPAGNLVHYQSDFLFQNFFSLHQSSHALIHHLIFCQTFANSFLCHCHVFANYKLSLVHCVSVSSLLPLLSILIFALSETNWK